MCVCICIHRVCEYIYIYPHVCMYTCMHVFTYVCMYDMHYTKQTQKAYADLSLYAIYR